MFKPTFQQASTNEYEEDFEEFEEQEESVPVSELKPNSSAFVNAVKRYQSLSGIINLNTSTHVLYEQSPIAEYSEYLYKLNQKQLKEASVGTLVAEDKSTNTLQIESKDSWTWYKDSGNQSSEFQISKETLAEFVDFISPKSETIKFCSREVCVELKQQDKTCIFNLRDYLLVGFLVDSDTLEQEMQLISVKTLETTTFKCFGTPTSAILLNELLIIGNNSAGIQIWNMKKTDFPLNLSERHYSVNDANESRIVLLQETIVYQRENTCRFHSLDADGILVYWAFLKETSELFVLEKIHLNHKIKSAVRSPFNDNEMYALDIFGTVLLLDSNANCTFVKAPKCCMLFSSSDSVMFLQWDRLKTLVIDSDGNRKENEYYNPVYLIAFSSERYLTVESRTLSLWNSDNQLIEQSILSFNPDSIGFCNSKFYLKDTDQISIFTLK